MLAEIFVLADIFLPAANFVLAEIFVLEEFFVPAANFVLTEIFVLAEFFMLLAKKILPAQKNEDPINKMFCLLKE